MDTYSIRLMRASDYQKVRKIDELTQIQYIGKKWNKLTKSEKENNLVTRKNEFRTNLDTGYCLVAKKDKKEIIGFMLAHEAQLFKGALYIRHIAILPNYQGKGIGKLFYDKLITIAKKHNVKKIVAYINLDNPKSIKMHEKVGFTLKNRKEATYVIQTK